MTKITFAIFRYSPDPFKSTISESLCKPLLYSDNFATRSVPYDPDKRFTPQRGNKQIFPELVHQITFIKSHAGRRCRIFPDYYRIYEGFCSASIDHFRPSTISTLQNKIDFVMTEPPNSSEGPCSD